MPGSLFGTAYDPSARPDLPQAPDPNDPIASRIGSALDFLRGPSVLDQMGTAHRLTQADLAQGGVPAMMADPSLRDLSTGIASNLNFTGIFGGPKAATADLGALQTAQAMDAAGERALPIWTKTGWFKSPDGHWKFEISDADAKLRPGNLGRGTAMEWKEDGAHQRPAHLGDVLDHPALYEAYPQLRDNVYYQGAAMPPGAQGSYAAANPNPNGVIGRLTLNTAADNPRSTVLHETQHAVQNVEGFDPGGATTLAAERIGEAQAAVETLHDKSVQTSVGLSAGTVSREEALAAHQQYQGALERYQSLLERGDDYDRYRLLQGEAEARAVQSRRDKSPAERADEFPLLSYDVHPATTLPSEKPWITGAEPPLGDRGPSAEMARGSPEPAPPAQLSYESIPGRTADHLPEMFDAPLDQRQAYHGAINHVLEDQGGRDVIAQAFGLEPAGPTLDAPGVYEGRVNPGSQALVRANPGATGEPDPALADRINAAELTRGLLLRQDAAAWHQAVFPQGGLTPELENTADLRIGRPFNALEAQGLEKALKAAGATDAALVSTPQGMRVINFADSDNPAFMSKVDKAVAGLHLGDDAHVQAVTGRSVGGYHGNDWSTSPHGEDYLDALDRLGPDVRGRAEALLRRLGPSVEGVDRDFAQRYGWTPSPAGGPWRQPTRYGTPPGGGSPALPAGRAAAAAGSPPPVTFGPERAAVEKPLFDLSHLAEVPNVPQENIPRPPPPARGYPDYALKVIAPDNMTRLRALAEKGRGMGGPEWYNTEPLRHAFVDELGEGAGNAAHRLYTELVAATSPRSGVRENIRDASYYYHLLQSGEPVPTAPPLPHPYGSMAQNLHLQNVHNIMEHGGIPPLQNPKPASFAENLRGNQAPATIDAQMAKAMGITDAHGGPADMPNQAHYGLYEGALQAGAKAAGMTPAQFQASIWSAMDHNGFPADPFMNQLVTVINRTASERGLTPKQTLTDFIRGKSPLLGLGPLGAGLAAMMLGGQPPEERR